MNIVNNCPVKIRLLFVFCLITVVCSAQKGKLLNGQVLADVKDLQGINVVNLASKKEVATDNRGLFSIYAKVGDTLLLTAVQLQPRKIALEKEDFDYMPFVIRMKIKITQLNEIIVKESTISAESLGIVPKGMKTYTPAERRLYTATTGSGFVSVDAILNAISGRTSMIKKEIVVEKHQMLQAKMFNMFDEDYLINELKIPTDYLEGFVVYASENKEVASAVKAKNRTLASYLLVGLAAKYNKMIADAK